MTHKISKKIEETFNILFCLDDNDGDYTRHCAVTILSLLATNKNNKIKIYILSGILPQENIDELKRIVDLYHQEIEFIIRDDIVPDELKKVIINRRKSIRGPRYRWFFPLFINNIDRILYMDCDVLVMGDISGIYNMDMHGKAIAGFLDCFPYRCKDTVFNLKSYINSGVLLFDTKKYNVKKINVKKMEEINKKYSKYFQGWDQDKANIIFKDDIFVFDSSMNYQVIGKYFNKGLNEAKIVHCLQKPYIINPILPNYLVETYYHYLDLTKRKGFPKKQLYSRWGNLYYRIRFFCLNFLIFVLGDKNMEKIIHFKRKLENYKSISNE